MLRALFKIKSLLQLTDSTETIKMLLCFKIHDCRHLQYNIPQIKYCVVHNLPEMLISSHGLYSSLSKPFLKEVLHHQLEKVSNKTQATMV